jgi:hypothetical protein
LVLLIVAGWAVALNVVADVPWLPVCVGGAFVAMALPRAHSLPKILALVVLAALAICPILDVDVVGVLTEGAGRGCFYGAFMAAVIALRDPVNASAAFGKAKGFISGRSAERSYPTLLIASHLLSLVLHMGSIGVVASLSERADASEPSKWAALATLHGFVTTTLWSPLSVAPAIVMAHMPAASHGMLTVSGMLVAALILLASMANRAAAPESQNPETRRVAPGRLALGDLGQIVVMILGIFALLQAAIVLLGISSMASVVVVIPVVVVAMTAAQSLQIGANGFVGTMKLLLFDRLPSRSDEVLLMVLVGVLGVAVSGLLENVPFAQFISGHRLGAAVVLVGCFWAIVAAALVGLNGLVSVVVLMEAIPAPQILGVPAELVALVFILGWGVSAAASPLTPTTLLVAEAFRTTATRVAFVWNGKFSLALLVLASIGIGLSASLFAVGN